MKKRFSSFLAGAASALLLAALCTTALAASGKISYNFVNVSLDGEAKITAGQTITAANGQQVPGSILYTDDAGGKTNYLPIRTISELLGVEIGYDSAAKTVLLGSRPSAQTAPADARWSMRLDDGSLLFESEGDGVKHDAPPPFRPAWQEEGWGLAQLRGGRSSVTWQLQKDGARVELLCSYPGGSIGYGMFRSPEKAIENRRQATVRGCQADLYAEGRESLLVWEDGDGILFYLTGQDVDAETLLRAAESIRPCGEASTWAPKYLPETTKEIESISAGDTRQDVWMVNGSSLTLLSSPCSMASLEGRAETVQVNGRAARFWAAREPAEPREVKTQTLGDVTVTTATVSGFGAAEMNTLTWSDPDSGMNFCLLSALDRDTMVKIAESVAP